MRLPIQLLSTDFDGTLHTEVEEPPVPTALQDLIAGLQSQGLVWVINTGRDLPSLMDTLEHAELSIWPDYVVTVERQIHCRSDNQYLELEHWNRGCDNAHDELFTKVRADLPQFVDWLKARFEATIYEDPYSPFCMIARNRQDAETIHGHLEDYSSKFAKLAVVRNDVYARFSHADYNKGSALAEIARLTGIHPGNIAAAGDHLNDLPMLSSRYARWLIAPGNAVDLVKEVVRREKGHVSEELYGRGVFTGLRAILDGVRPEQIA